MMPSSRLPAIRQWPAILLAAMWPVAAMAAAADSTDGISAADYYVRDLPGLPEDIPPIKMHAG